jgi:hypothetical protein
MNMRVAWMTPCQQVQSMGEGVIREILDLKF